MTLKEFVQKCSYVCPDEFGLVISSVAAYYGQFKITVVPPK